MKPNLPKFVIIHHTERNNDFPVFVRWRHKFLRKWDDIGYHYLIGNTRPFTKDGKLYLGRPENMHGAHAQGYNFNSIGICLIGNFDNKLPSEKQMNTLIGLIREKTCKYNIPVENILGHNELPNVKKSCPGSNIDMYEIRLLVRRDLEFVRAPILGNALSFQSKEGKSYGLWST